MPKGKLRIKKKKGHLKFKILNIEKKEFINNV